MDLQALEKVWKHGVEAYQSGKRGAETFFEAAQLAYLASIGQNAQEFYDYAEDYANYGEPSFEEVAAVAKLRLAYFRDVQKGRPTGKTLAASSLPAKSASVEGIEWLPRAAAKARLKLRGELSREIMYGCAGDRAFFKRWGLTSDAFLRIVRECPDDTAVAVVLRERVRG